jgi:cytochrome c oxidase cbb3-type subunit 4
MIDIDHAALVGFAKSFGLFYLLALSAAVLIYAYWPGNKKRFDAAAGAVLRDEERRWR